MQNKENVTKWKVHTQKAILLNAKFDCKVFVIFLILITNYFSL